MLKVEQKDFLKLKDEEYENIKQSLAPLMECLKNKKIMNTFQESIRLNKKRLYISLEALSIVNRTYSELNPKQYSLLILMNYLSFSEGFYSELIQLISFLLLENHHDIYDPQKMEFAKRYNDLDKIPFFVKLKFIKKHDLKSVLTYFDRDLRNCIAHMNYSIDDKGIIIYKKTKLTKQQIWDKFKSLLEMSIKIFMALSDQLITILKSIEDIKSQSDKE